MLHLASSDGTKCLLVWLDGGSSSPNVGWFPSVHYTSGYQSIHWFLLAFWIQLKLFALAYKIPNGLESMSLYSCILSFLTHFNKAKKVLFPSVYLFVHVHKSHSVYVSWETEPVWMFAPSPLVSGEGARPSQDRWLLKCSHTVGANCSHFPNFLCCFTTFKFIKECNLHCTITAN